MEACRLNFLGCVVVLECADHFLHLLRRYVEAGGRSPDAVSSGAENGGFVDIAGADETVAVVSNASTVGRSERYL